MKFLLALSLLTAPLPAESKPDELLPDQEDGD
jgi:hypothetical protein